MDLFYYGKMSRNTLTRWNTTKTLTQQSDRLTILDDILAVIYTALTRLLRFQSSGSIFPVRQ